MIVRNGVRPSKASTVSMKWLTLCAMTLAGSIAAGWVLQLLGFERGWLPAAVAVICVVSLLGMMFSSYVFTISRVITRIRSKRARKHG